MWETEELDAVLIHILFAWMGDGENDNLGAASSQASQKKKKSDHKSITFTPKPPSPAYGIVLW